MTEEAGTKQVRVMHVEDHPDFRDLMEVLLNGQSDLKLVSEAGSLAEGRAQAARFEIDVVILDLGLPDGNGVDLIADLRRANPDVRVLILSADLNAASSESTAGADEIMDKFAPLDEVLATIRCLGST